MSAFLFAFLSVWFGLSVCAGRSAFIDSAEPEVIDAACVLGLLISLGCAVTAKAL